MYIFNMVSIKSGGGQQNALSFLENLDPIDLKFEYIVVCTDATLVHKYCIKKGIETHVVKKGILSRLHYEFLGFFYLKNKYKIKVIFTLFGSAPIVSFGVYKISGCAYSNIFQPEVNIWGYLGAIGRIIKRMVDIFRVYTLLQADEIILETPFLLEKAKQGLLKNKKVSVIEMAPSKLVTDKLKAIIPVSLNKDNYTLLCLSGAQPNKRIDKFLDVLFHLNKNENKKKFILKITIDKKSNYFVKNLLPKIRELSLDSYIVNIGTVAPGDVSSVIESSDAIVNVALIESFSNNWVEAWASRRLLITTDADWSRASCKNAALYIDVLNPEEASTLIMATFNSYNSFSGYLVNGCARLRELPSSRDRTQQYINLLNSYC